MQYKVEHMDVPCTLEELLASKWNFSKRLIRQLKSSFGCLRVNDNHAKVIDALQVDDLVQIQFPKEKRSVHMTPHYIPLSIVYEDEDILIIDKQAGLAMSPSPQYPSETLANGIIYYYDTCHLPYTIHFVTRLDRDTSGLVVVAKHRYMHALLNEELQEGRLTRSYEAIVEGRMKKTTGKIDEPIARKTGSIIERVVDPLGQRSITHYDVIEQMQGYSHVRAQLETGRTHQIRVHFSHIGHPLVGDGLYGGKTGEIRQQALHCTSIIFTHPRTKEILEFKTPLRQELVAFLTKNKLKK